MGKRDAYEPGVFCWVDLATDDVGKAQSFYENLFGWEFDERDAGDGHTYVMASRDGAVVAGLMNKLDEGPPRWQSYIAVESAEDSAAKAEEAGAQVVMAAMDVGPAGRTAVLQDPSGAIVFVWEAKQRAGAELVNEVGAWCWNDLTTHDVDKAFAFYSSVFGWELGAVEDAPGNRHGIRVGETMNGGMAEFPESMGDGAPSHWLACFAVDDVEATMQGVEQGGGSAVTPVVDIPTGKFAVAEDATGAVFGVVDGDMDP